jgi:hypothetical protein
MEFDNDKIDDDVLALLYLTAFKEKKDWPWRTWKGHDWEAMNRLCEKGYISDPKNKAKSVTLSDEGYVKAKQLFEAKYAKKG